MSEPVRLFELHYSCQSARPLGLRRPDFDDDDGGRGDNDSDCDDDNVDNDDLDMHPEPGHDSVASTQTSLCQLYLGVMLWCHTFGYREASHL